MPSKNVNQHLQGQFDYLVQWLSPKLAPQRLLFYLEFRFALLRKSFPFNHPPFQQRAFFARASNASGSSLSFSFLEGLLGSISPGLFASIYSHSLVHMFTAESFSPGPSLGLNDFRDELRVLFVECLEKKPGPYMSLLGQLAFFQRTSPCCLVLPESKILLTLWAHQQGAGSLSQARKG